MPTPTPLSRAFWRATRDHRLILQRCDKCEGYEWTPQMACSRCLTETLSWVAVSGEGTIYSYSVVHRPQSAAFVTPYIVAIVELREGVRMLTSLVDAAPDAVTIGMPVRVVFRDEDELAVYEFRPDPSRAVSDR